MSILNRKYKVRDGYYVVKYDPRFKYLIGINTYLYNLKEDSFQLVLESVMKKFEGVKKIPKSWRLGFKETKIIHHHKLYPDKVRLELKPYTSQICDNRLMHFNDLKRPTIITTPLYEDFKKNMDKEINIIMKVYRVIREGEIDGTKYELPKKVSLFAYPKMTYYLEPNDVFEYEEETLRTYIQVAIQIPSESLSYKKFTYINNIASKYGFKITPQKKSLP